MLARVCRWIGAVGALAACSESANAPEPILERSARDALHCEVTSELRGFGLTVDDFHDQVNNIVPLADDELWTARTVESEIHPQLVVSPLSFSDEGGEDQLVDEDAEHVAARASIALPGGGFALLWIREDPTPALGRARSLWFAAFDAAGTATVAARQVEGVQPGNGFPLRAAVSSSGNIGVLYPGVGRTAWFATLDQVGDAWGVSHAAPAEVSALIALPAGGFALLGQDTGPDGREELLFSKIEETSETQVDPVPIARAEGGRTLWMGAALIPAERGYLAAWSEARTPQGDYPWEHPSGSHAIIRLRRLDAQGRPQATPVTLRAARDSVSDRRPALAQFGEQVALFWSTGAYNYDCEESDACWHRDRGQFILLDPADLAPRSDLVELLRDRAFPNGQAEPRLGDLIGAALHVRDGEVLVTATLQDDDNRRLAPGFASLRCE